MCEPEVCVGRGRGGTAGGCVTAADWGCPVVTANVLFISKDEEREWEAWGLGGGGGGAVLSGEVPEWDRCLVTTFPISSGSEL